MKTFEENLEKHLENVAFKVVMSDRNAAQFAKINSEDNFCLAMFGVAYNAIMNKVIGFDTEKQWDWFNKNVISIPTTRACSRAFKKLNNKK